MNLSNKLHFLILIVTVKSYNILIIYNLPLYSHYTLVSTLAFELADRGHNITFINPVPRNITRKNLKEISSETSKKILPAHGNQIYGLSAKNPLELIKFSTKSTIILLEETLKNINVQTFIKSNEKYDLVVISWCMNEAVMAFGQIFKAPIVALTSTPLIPWNHFYLNHPAPPSYIPVVFSSFSSRMNFWQRCLNTFYDFYAISFYHYYCLPKQRELVKKYFSNSLDLDQFINNISLVLINSHSSIYDSTPKMPNTIEIGGFHLKKSQPLSVILQEFMDQSRDGVVLFSLGSNLKISKLDSKIVKDFLKSFSKLKQNVLMKWETDEIPADASENIRFVKWIPQNDVLAHPNIKAFITHGGLLSTTESIYHGVPLIGIPFFTDQKMNMAHASNLGYGILMHLDTVTEETLTDALNQILYDSKYTETVKIRSRIMKDQPMKPLDTAIYWIEYVVRHKGAYHLRYAGTELSWYQRNLIDVIVFFILITLIVLYVIMFVIKSIVRLLVSNRRKIKYN